MSAYRAPSRPFPGWKVTPPPLGLLPWPPTPGLVVHYRRSPRQDAQPATVIAHAEREMPSGPLRLVELRGLGRQFWAPWDRCSAAGAP